MLKNNLLKQLKTASLTRDTIRNLIKIGKFEKIKSQTKVITSGEICDTAYFVLKGGFVCRHIDKELKVKRTINFYLDNFHPFMICVDGYFKGSKTKCELKAIKNSEILKFNKEELDDLIYKDEKLFQFYHQLIVRALESENDMKMKMISGTTEQLFNHTSKDYQFLMQSVPSKYIAEFMGISPEWLSKLKHKNIS